MKTLWLANRWFVIPAGIVLLFVAAGVVMAVDQSGPFELDGNAVDDPGGGIDWANIYKPQTEQGAEQRQFIVDASGPNADNIFTQGGSKDVNDISQWRHTAGNVPDKDNILDGYATAMNANGNTMLYFGADRAANNGDAQIGVWLLADHVAPLPDGTFSGSHTGNDLLILSNFAGGGGTSHIQVSQWNGQADPGNPLLLLAEATANGVLSVCTQGDVACAYTNKGGEKSPWPYIPKSGKAGIFPAVSFFEGGVNLTALLGPGGVGCDADFLIETRSSQETSAELKDLVAGSLKLCGLTLTTTGSPRSKVGDPITYTVTLENTGVVRLTLQSISGSVVGDLAGAAGAAGCQSLAAGATCQFSVTHTVQPGDPDLLVNTVTATYHAGSAQAVTASGTSQTDLFQPAITFDKVGDAQSAAPGDVVKYTLTLTNTSSSDSPNLTCRITDPMLKVDQIVNLAADGQHVVTAAYTVQANDPNPLVNTALAHCQVDGFPNILELTDNYSVAITTPAAKPIDTPTPTVATPASGTLAPTETTAPGENEGTPSQTPEPSETPEVITTQEIALTGEGCSPGFWQGGRGRWLWNEPNDPDWKGAGTNPFTHQTDFNSVFTPYPATAGFNMYSFVRGGGGPNDWHKAARSLVAAYLNTSYGMHYPFTPQQIAQMWADAVSGSRTFMEIHQTLDAANNLGCPID